MMGFLAAVLVEAGTGSGILGQLIMYFKASGLLGEASGF
jgi:tRNA A58 N-methylase Trm61